MRRRHPLRCTASTARRFHRMPIRVTLRTIALAFVLALTAVGAPGPAAPADAASATLGPVRAPALCAHTEAPRF